ncbi:hypothetical protein Ddc_18288 [Ditylenchus destructor]|nr:hypothetical protein Ddc_18288 [Ditylenchus destructor]
MNERSNGKEFFIIETLRPTLHLQRCLGDSRPSFPPAAPIFGCATCPQHPPSCAQMNSSKLIPSEMEYVKYMNVGFNIAIALLHVTTIFFTCHVTYCSKFDKKSAKLDRISNSFFIFLCSRGFGAMLALPYPVYLTIYWSAKGQ